ncbi:MAG: hypothetical protein J6583_10900 [Gilliamella sp.]|uniref:hypothetical protein n=1 Tax=Gilliamella sp. TaxID=1891236 RepID=UPI0025CF7EE7|nr:hypothetical protein [Gilliamella sp.]MCO6545509.1 hypothetical protein [Gilliamella sp.]MCO6548269.1 hypothetical protein [Gilliamella sp.]
MTEQITQTEALSFSAGIILIYEKIKDKFFLSVSEGRDSDLLGNQFFDTELEAKEYFIVEFCEREIDKEYGLEIQFNVMKESFNQHSMHVFILTVEDEVLNFEKINDYDYSSEDTDFKSRDEYVKWVFGGFSNSGISPLL